MASLSIAALFTFYVNESKSVSRGENHFKSEHVLSCSYFEGLITGKVRASMKNKEYSVRVSAFISRKFQQFKAHVLHLNVLVNMFHLVIRSLLGLDFYLVSIEIKISSLNL